MFLPTPLTSIFKTSLLLDSLASATQIVVEYNGADSNNGKSVKKLSKSQRIVKSQKTLRA